MGRYSSFGLDETKVARDEGERGKFWCLWHDGDVQDRGFSLCFSNWTICKPCVDHCGDHEHLSQWFVDDCFKCGNKQVQCFHSVQPDPIPLCEECMGLARHLLNKTNHGD